MGPDGSTGALSEPIAPFRLAVPDAELEDLLARVRGTRWPRSWAGDPVGLGVPDDDLRRLIEHWGDGYDWRAHEADINALDQALADLDGTTVHLIRVEAERTDALPIVLTHGWPSSFLELMPLAERLAHPSRHGGDPADAFHVVVPSLPGFAFSAQGHGYPSEPPAEELWHQLMTGALGYRRYAAHGGDLGAGVTLRLAAAHPDAVVGIHVLAVGFPAEIDQTSLTSEESAYLAALDAWNDEAGGYMHEQATRPLTLGYGLSDSPVGLLAWLVEKYRAWSDCDGVLSRRWTDDEVLTQASLYWFTNTISTSFRPYAEFRRRGRPASRPVSVPTALAVFPADLSHPPRSWAERTCHITRYTAMPRGGHFAAHEEPELLAADITAHFRSLR